MIIFYGYIRILRMEIKYRPANLENKLGDINSKLHVETPQIALNIFEKHDSTRL